MQKFKQFSHTILLILILVLIFSFPAAAEFFNGNLVDFVKTDNQITVPIFSPTKKIEIKAAADTVLTAAGSEDLELKKGDSYFITQSELQPALESVEAEAAEEDKEAKSGWGVQLLAASTREKALEFKEQAAAEIEVELLILEEEGLFKVVAGSAAERSRAEALQQQLKEQGYNSWPREFKLTKDSGKPSELKVKNEVQAEAASDSKRLNLYNAAGKKLREAHVFVIDGSFTAAGNKMQGEFQFGPLGNSVLFSYKTDLEELTAYLLQKHLNPGAPAEALKAQAVLYRTALIYQLEIQGARLENLGDLSLGTLNPVFAEAAAAVRSQVLIRGDDFYYNHDFSLKELRKPKVGIISLAQAEYSFEEIIDYYYERSELTNLNQLLDSQEKFSAHIERGLKFREIRQVSWAGPRFITVIDYNLNEDSLSLKPVLAQGIVPGREDLAELIKKHSALAGVNGGYFHYSGRPLGLLYINGSLVSEPLYKRSALLIGKDNQLSLARVDWAGEVLIESGSHKIKLDGVNRRVNQDQIILFNHYYGSRMPALSAEQYDIVVRDHKILGLESEVGVETPIPPDGFVLRASASRTDTKIKISKLKDKTVELNYNLSPNFEENNILHAVGGGPRLLKDGEIAINGREENFQNDILNGRSPRTAAALTEDNHLLFLTIDGRRSDFSVGMTLEELAQALKDLGAVDALNLDGGGSARMVIRGFTMSSPSEKRLISNGVMVEQDD